MGWKSEGGEPLPYEILAAQAARDYRVIEAVISDHWFICRDSARKTWDQIRTRNA
jgi:hypothetical protein